jgi:predicted CxxxxCH...CXXCH cytochrome family protein
LVDTNNRYILDAYGNLVYDPYTVTITRNYRVTPPWIGGSLGTACSDCHQFPPTTAYPQVEAGVGDSHNWIDAYGYSNLHSWNMGYDPLSCRTCHYGEIVQANTWTRVADVTYYDPVPLADKTQHVNGQADVRFDDVNPVRYTSSWSGTTTTYSLASATYDAATKSCSNVGCHKLQTYVVWGSPYRWDGAECDLCHRYGTIPPPSAPAPQMLFSAAANGTKNNHPFASKDGCLACHARGK